MRRQLRFAKIWAINLLLVCSALFGVGILTVVFGLLMINYPLLGALLAMVICVLIITFIESEKELKRLEEQEERTLQLLSQDNSTTIRR